MTKSELADRLGAKAGVSKASANGLDRRHALDHQALARGESSSGVPPSR